MYWSARRRSPARAYTAASAYLKRGVSSSSGVSVFCKWLTASANYPAREESGKVKMSRTVIRRIDYSSVQNISRLCGLVGEDVKKRARETLRSRTRLQFSLCVPG